MRRKYLAALLALVIMLVSAAGCGSAKENNDAPQMRVGVLTAVNLTSEEFSSALQNRDFSVRLTAGQGGAAFEYEDSLRERLEGAEITAVYYDTLSTMLMGLQTGDIDAFAISKTVADYLCAQNASLRNAVPVTRDGDRSNPFNVSFSLLMTEENQALCRELDQALAELTADGTLNRLRSERIYDLSPDSGNEPAAFAQFDGADTIRIAVTGDLPPMDYMSADGTPSGFNTALLAELGRRLQKNILLVSVDSGARASALAGDAADVVFWARTVTEEGNDSDSLSGMDIPDGTIVTEPYFMDMAAIVYLPD